MPEGSILAVKYFAEMAGSTKRCSKVLTTLNFEAGPDFPKHMAILHLPGKCAGLWMTQSVQQLSGRH